MSIDNVKKVNNQQDLIFSSGAALGGGLLSAYAGGSSVKFFENGMPADTFVNSVKSKIMANADSASVHVLKAFEKYYAEIENAKRIEDFMSAFINFRRNCQPNLSFSELKKNLLKDLTQNYEYLNFAKENDKFAEIAVDVYCNIRDAENTNQLKSALTNFKNNFWQNVDIEEIRELTKEKFAKTIVDSGYETASLDLYLRQAIQQSFDPDKNKFVFDKNKITKQLFDVVKDTADDIKLKTKSLYGLLGALTVGGVTYSIIKINDLLNRPNGKNKVNKN